MTALDESIEKWRLIWGANGKDDGAQNCALCIKYHYDKCNGCIIKEKTEKSRCINTPYDEWDSHHENIHWIDYPRQIVIGCKECSRLAFEQYRFMRSLKN